MNPLAQASPDVDGVLDGSMRVVTAATSRQAEVDAAVRDDRDRIASDLHDSVIQRIFAAALSVDALRARQSDGEIVAELAHIVDDLDRCAVEIRSVIYRLCPDDGSGGLESDLLAVLEEEGPALGLTPTVQMRGDLGSVGGEWRHHLVAIFRELLSNIARHAQASHVEILVEVGEAIWVRVGDDGIGFDPARLRYGRGIRNVTQRASALGGSLLIHARPGGGTVVECLVPLPG